eukprot:1187423-Prorocentrum_minimum.AAC.1
MVGNVRGGAGGHARRDQDAPPAMDGARVGAHVGGRGARARVCGGHQRDLQPQPGDVRQRLDVRLVHRRGRRAARVCLRRHGEYVPVV